MNAKRFISECLVRGVGISLDGDALRVEGDIKPAIDNYIRIHKTEIIAALNTPTLDDEPTHGLCVGCGEGTASMLTTPNQTWCWECVDCFDQRHALHSKNATSAIV